MDHIVNALKLIPYSELRNLGDGGDLTRFRKELSLEDRNEYDEFSELTRKSFAYNPQDSYKPYKYNKKRLEELRKKFKPLLNTYFEMNKVTVESIVKLYYNARESKDYPELVEAIDNILLKYNEI